MQSRCAVLQPTHGRRVGLLAGDARAAEVRRLRDRVVSELGVALLDGRRQPAHAALHAAGDLQRLVHVLPHELRVRKVLDQEGLAEGVVGRVLQIFGRPVPLSEQAKLKHIGRVKGRVLLPACRRQCGMSTCTFRGIWWSLLPNGIWYYLVPSGGLSHLGSNSDVQLAREGFERPCTVLVGSHDGS